ncbi:MAG: PAS domain S-box protein [Capsulimonadales bacterium]|nr:PAS domain S-box protein [Capsulimonadales bacterium]
MRRTTLLGFCFGLLFPILGTFLECLRRGMLSVNGFLTVQADTPLLWIIDTAPFILAGAGYLIVYAAPENRGDIRQTGRGLPSLFVGIGLLPALLLSLALVRNQDAATAITDSNRCTALSITAMEAYFFALSDESGKVRLAIGAMTQEREDLRRRYAPLLARSDAIWASYVRLLARPDVDAALLRSEQNWQTVEALVVAYRHLAGEIETRQRRILSEASAVFVAGLLISFALLPFGMGLIRRVRLTEKQLREEHDLVAAILKTAGAIIVTLDAEGRVRSLNEAGERLTGFAAADRIGHPFGELMRTPEEREATEQRFLRLKAGDPIGQNEEDWTDHRGQRRRIAWSDTALKNPDGTLRLLICAGIDVTEQRQAEETLRRSDARLNEAQRIARIGSWEYDIVADRITWSAEMFRLLEFAPADGEPDRHRLLDRYHPEDREMFRSVFRQAMLDGAPYEIELRTVSEDGDNRWFRARGYGVRDGAGKVIRLIGTVQDVTEYRRIQDELRQTASDLADTADRLRRSNTALQEFTAVASHDLRSPLRQIRHQVKQLSSAKNADPTVRPEQADRLRRIDRACERMQHLIDNLLELARVTARGETVVRRPVDLAQILDDVRIDLGVRLRETGGTIETGPLPVFYGDPAQIYRLMLNLVGNGLKFHREGIPPLVRVERTANSDGGCVGFVVRDNGIGFSAEDAGRIFKAFERLDNHDREGSGIGLSICQRIVENHGGRISVRSVPGEGSAFTIVLPGGDGSERLPDNLRSVTNAENER